MSTFVHYIDKEEAIPLHDFLLNEAYGITQPIDYGSNDDLNDKKFRLIGGILYTYFQLDGYRFIVGIALKTGHIAFGATKEKTFDPAEYFFNKSPVGKALTIFNRVMYVLSKVIEHYNGNKIIFEGAYSELREVYSGMVKNKSFIKLMNENGWSFESTKEHSHTFVRKTK